jgi:hypothetical protein
MPTLTAGGSPSLQIRPCEPSGHLGRSIGCNIPRPPIAGSGGAFRSAVPAALGPSWVRAPAWERGELSAGTGTGSRVVRFEYEMSRLILRGNLDEPWRYSLGLAPGVPEC